MLKLGDRVIVDPAIFPKYAGIVYTVKKRLPVNVELDRVGGGRGLKIKPAYLLPAPEGATNVPGQATVTTIAVPDLRAGQVVKVAGAGWKEDPEQLWVVLDVRADNTHKITKLGGWDRGRYYTKIPRVFLTVVDV